MSVTLMTILACSAGGYAARWIQNLISEKLSTNTQEDPLTPTAVFELTPKQKRLYKKWTKETNVFLKNTICVDGHYINKKETLWFECSQSQSNKSDDTSLESDQKSELRVLAEIADKFSELGWVVGPINVSWSHHYAAVAYSYNHKLSAGMSFSVSEELIKERSETKKEITEALK